MSGISARHAAKLWLTALGFVLLVGAGLLSAPPAEAAREAASTMGTSGEMACDGICAASGEQICAAAIAVTSASLLALLLSRRRHTLLGLRPRLQASSGLRAGLRLPRLWSVRPQFHLCVLRV